MKRMTRTVGSERETKDTREYVELSRDEEEGGGMIASQESRHKKRGVCVWYVLLGRRREVREFQLRLVSGVQDLKWVFI